MINNLKAIVLDHLPSEQELLFMQESIDIHFKKQSQLERLTRWERLRVLGVTVSEIARQTGFKQGTVSRTLGLSRLGPEARAMLATISDMEKAYIASEEPDSAKQVELMKEGTAGLTREQLRRRVRGVEMRAHKAVFSLPTGMMILVQGKQMTLKDAVEALLALTKELRQALREGWDITTASRVLADRAKVQS